MKRFFAPIKRIMVMNRLCFFFFANFIVYPCESSARCTHPPTAHNRNESKTTTAKKLVRLTRKSGNKAISDFMKSVFLCIEIREVFVGPSVPVRISYCFFIFIFTKYCELQVVAKLFAPDFL